MWTKEKEFTVKLGGMTFVNVETVMSFKGMPIFAVDRSESTGEIAISFELFDAKGNKLASVKQNRIYKNPKHAGNLTIDGNADTLTLTDTSNGNELIRIVKTQSAETGPDVFMKTYLPNGTLFEARPDGTNLSGNFFNGVTMNNSKIGVDIT